MATSRPIKHIEREDLYTNLEARVQYLHSFLDFSSRKSILRNSQEDLVLTDFKATLKRSSLAPSMSRR